MGTTPDFESMNEADVREVVVRPLLESLGYSHGTDAYIRTEWTLRYAKAFLGRKNPKRDPDLVGRADYVCGVVSFGCWIVEVKSPAEPITLEDIQQAHTYAAHPEIAASHFLVTNGREFKLYQTSRLGSAVLEWKFQDTDDNSVRLFNVLSPAAVRTRARAGAVDPGKPLGRGLASRLRLIGGEILYEHYESNHPFFQQSPISGLRLPVVGGTVTRVEDRIVGHLEVSKAAPMLFAGEHEPSDAYTFFSAAEYISDDPETPTIFQNLITHVVPAGRKLNSPGWGIVPMPFEYSLSAYTEAIGYISKEKFLGTMQFSCDFRLSKIAPLPWQVLSTRFGNISDHGHLTGAGRFEISLLQDF